MLKKKAKFRKRLARIVMAALLCSGGLHGLAAPSVAEAATTITVSNITGNAATGAITVTADPAGSMFGQYDSKVAVFKVRPDAAITGISEINITGSTIPAFVYGVNRESADAGSRRVTVSGANTVLGAVYVNGQDEGIATNNNTLIVEDASITGIDNNQRLAEVSAGATAGGEASGNRIEIRNATIGKADFNNARVYAGYTESKGNAAGNSVTVEGDATKIYGLVWAGMALDGDATGNEVNISGGTIGAEGMMYQVVGGGAIQTAGNNTVTIKGGRVLSGAYGGYSKFGPATGNALNIEGGTVYAGVNWRDEDYAAGYDSVNLAGGFSIQSVASESTVTVDGGEFTGGERKLTVVCGGFSHDSDTVKNKVVVNGGTGLHDVFGGSSINGNVENNEVYINTGANVNSAIGADTENGNATGNKVTISGGRVCVNPDVPYGYGVVSGGSAVGTASSNTVTVSGGTVNVNLAGGDSRNGTATSNTLIISGGTFGTDNSNTEKIYGGYAESFPSDNGVSPAAAANDNTVTVSGGTFGTEDSFTEIFGGYAWSSSDGGTAGTATANNNSVTISGNPVFKGDVAIAGGAADSETLGEACNNTVTVLTPVTVYGLFGGYKWYDGTSAGNTLNIAAKNVIAAIVGRFQNMYFYLPADIANGDTMLTVNGGSPTNVKGVTFGVTTQPGVDLLKGDSVNLISNVSGLTTNDTLATTTSMTAPKDIATDTNYQLTISKKDANTIMATVTDRTLSPNDKRMATTGKSPAETRAAVATQVNAGADLIAGMGMANASDAAAGSSGGMEPFAAMGLSSLRAQSGSHVDTKGIGLALGFAKEIQNGSGKLLVGPLVEYGYGRYDSYQDDNSKADGKSHYWGFGVIAKQTNDSGLYYEGSLRIGKAKSDYGRDDAVFGRMGYDSDSTYWGAHLGIGKVQHIGHDNTLDYYGKYFYSHTGGDSVFIRGLNAMADFGSVDSHRLRVGARVTHAVNEKNKIYGGLAYQYEFNGDTRVTYNPGGSAPSPSVKGSSGMVELGWQVKPGRSPMVIDLGVTGWVGKQRGITANLQANWTF